jgi:Family of unknown function (DUF6176)
MALEVVFHRVKRDQVERLRAWLQEGETRADEIRETFRQETVRHEAAYLLEGRDGPILVYAMEAEDFERAADAFRSSTLPIDLQHREVMRTVLDGPADVEKLYEVALD